MKESTFLNFLGIFLAVFFSVTSVICVTNLVIKIDPMATDKFGPTVLDKDAPLVLDKMNLVEVEQSILDKIDPMKLEQLYLMRNMFFIMFIWIIISWNINFDYSTASKSKKLLIVSMILIPILIIIKALYLLVGL